ncbi:MAG: DUF433 domain-containing protein [Phycisphaerales bacterium]
MIRWQDRITCTPGVMGGRPCIAGTRVTLRTVLANLAAGHATEDVLKEYPTLYREDIDAVVVYDRTQTNLPK